MTETKQRPYCVTEVRKGNSVLVVSGFLKQSTTDTAADEIMKILEAEAARRFDKTRESGHAKIA